MRKQRQNQGKKNFFFKVLFRFVGYDAGMEREAAPEGNSSSPGKNLPAGQEKWGGREHVQHDFQGDF